MGRRIGILKGARKKIKRKWALFVLVKWVSEVARLIHTYRVRGRLALLARLHLRAQRRIAFKYHTKSVIYIRPIEQILKVIYTEFLFDWSRLQIMNKIAYEMSRPRVRGYTVVWGARGAGAGGLIAGKYSAVGLSPPDTVCPRVETSNFIVLLIYYKRWVCAHSLSHN